MAIGDSYITLAELRAHLRVSDSDDDQVLQRVARSVSRGIERYTRRQFNKGAAPTARTYRPESSRLVRVDDFHTSTGLVVTIDEDENGTYETTIAAADYTLEPLGGIVDGRSGFPFERIRLNDAAATLYPSHHSPGSVRVTADWGWASVPDEVKDAALILAARLFGRRQAPHGLIGQGEFVFRVSRQRDPDVVELLAPLVRADLTVLVA